MTLVQRENFRRITLEFLQSRYSEEVWVFHPELENILVSNLGNIKNHATGNVLKKRTNKNGYLVCSININKVTKSFIVSRLVAQTFFSYCGNEYEANHLNGDKYNNSVYNLNWLTRKENLEHARNAGLFRKKVGEDNNNHKYSVELLREIAEFKKLGYTYKQLSAAYKIPPTYICTMLKRKEYV